MMRRVEELRRQEFVLSRKIVHEEERLAEMETRKGAHAASIENKKVIAKQVQALENQLELANVRLGKSLQDNRRLVEDIGECRRNRAAFDVVYKRTEKQLQVKQLQARKMAQCAEETQIARDKIRMELDNLRVMSDQERFNFSATVVDSSQSLGALRSTLTHSPLTFSSAAEVATMSFLDAEATLKQRRQTAKALWRLGSDKAADKLKLDRLQQYRADAKRISDATQLSLEQFLSVLEEGDDRHFDMFQHVNSLSAEIEKLEEAVAQVRYTLESKRARMRREEVDAARSCQELRELVVKKESMAEDLFDKHDGAKSLLGKLKHSMMGLCNTLRVPGSSLEILTDATVRVLSDKEIVTLFGAAEMRIDELIRRFCQEVDPTEPLFVSLEREGALRGMLEHSVPSSASSSVTKAKDRRKSGRRNAGKSLGVATMLHTGLRSSPVPVAIVPPEIADGATDEFDDDLRPLSRHELQKLHISGKQQYLGGEL